jgi:alpha-maltose-1-phosphate synthase
MTATAPGQDDSPVKVAVLRAGDLEARELLLFDRLSEQGLLDAGAFGGVSGLTLPVTVYPSLGARLDSVALGRPFRRLLRRRLGADLSHSPGLERVLASYSVINARETFQSQTARAARWVSARPYQRLVVSCFENIPFRYEEDDLLHGNKERVRKLADMFIANSPGARAALEVEGVPRDRIHIVPPGIDTSHFAPGPRSDELRAQWRAEHDDIVILYAGRLVAEKGLVELTLALRDLLSLRNDTRLVFHGAGPERSRLEHTSRTLGLGDRVAFSDWVAPTQMPDIYRSADIVVLPSLSTPYWREQFGFNLVEAMACGRPLVGASTGEIAWVIGSGGVTSSGDDRTLRAAVEALVRDGDKRLCLADAARREAVARFSVDTAGRQLVECFRDSLSRPGRHAPASRS